MQAIVITGGSIDDKFTLDFIDKTPYDILIAVDKGLLFFEGKQLNPHYIIGDFDSVPKKILDKYRKNPHVEIQEYQPQKDETDTELAVMLALLKGCKNIFLLGATGTRLDHVMGNIELLGLGFKHQAECVILDPYNKIRLIKERMIIKADEQFGDYVSLIPYTQTVTGLTLEGFLYPLKDYTMNSFYMEDRNTISAVSNVIVAQEGIISFKEGILLVIEAKDK
ncbi:thiamine diphosphokinase [Lachnospiraceae bacterium ZAX-1]